VLAAAAALRVAVCARLRYSELAPAPVRTCVNEVDDRPAFRFGRTIVSVAVGDLLGQEAELIVVAANRRGVLGPLATPGLSGLRSLGGSEIEREAMSLAPLELGTAVMTGASGLEERGIRAVVHAVIHPALGERARIEDVRRAVPAALTAAAKSRLRTVAMPLLGVESLATKADVDAMVAAVVDELVGSLRRAISRVDRLTIVCRFDEHADTLEAALAKAHERVWTRVP
jgi:O-acetyl-ADP-ribose deacetylase